MAERDARVSLKPVNERHIRQRLEQDYDTRGWREYKCNAPRRGRAVIANFYSFKDEKHTRRGSEKDVERLVETLGNKLKFDVDVWKLEGVEADVFLKMVEKEAMQKEKHAKGDCFLMVLMTHGDQQGILMAHDSVFKLDQVVSFFTGEKCSSLKGKPKIFIVQACRGGDGQEAVFVAKGPCLSREKPPLEQMISLPTHADLLIAQSQYEGFYSLRHFEKGSYFIQSLCDVLDHDFLKPDEDKDDLLRLLTFASHRVANFEFSEALYSGGDTGTDTVMAEVEESDSSGSDDVTEMDANPFCPTSAPKKKKKPEVLLSSKIVKQQPTLISTLLRLLFFRNKGIDAKA